MFADFSYKMEKIKGRNRVLSILHFTMNILCFFISVSAQPGFVNIDCGGRRNSTDSETNMSWIEDTNYVDVGHTANFSMPDTPFHMQSLRFFPKPLNKSCYRLPLIPNVNYLLRLWFLFGNYKESQKLPSFNVSFETEGLLTQQVQSIKFAQTVQWTSEKILTSPNSVLYVCLIRTSDDSDPFVSAIQLRSLVSGMYSLQVKPGIMLNSLARHDLGYNLPGRIRYPEDEFDRFWSCDNDLDLEINNGRISKRSGNFISTKNNSRNFPPNVVLQTALITKTATQPLAFTLEREYAKTLVVLYAAEIEVLNASEYRKFSIVINNIVVRNISLDANNNFAEVPITYNETGVEIIVSLETAEDETNRSNRKAILNALEYYKVIESEPVTDPSDVGALLSIKTAFGMDDWISDPCFAVAWKGINCNRSLAVRVVEIDLSGRNLSGSLPNHINDLIELRNLYIQDNHFSGLLPDLCKLSRLEILRLQNNNFSGAIPDCLSRLKYLKELNLENNHFSGIVPEGLLRNGLLDLKYNGNPNLCKDESHCHSRDNKIKIVVVSVIGSLVGCLLVLISVIMHRRRKNLKEKEQMNSHQSSTKRHLSMFTQNLNSHYLCFWNMPRITSYVNCFPNKIADAGLTWNMIPKPSSCSSFSLLEMKTATSNFSQKIGEGGFGSVYFGKLADGKYVAVKLLSSSSKQGLAEFLNEINLLSRVHHKNLVRLIGYCNESEELMLVYEHMCGGSLKDHLYGSLSNNSTLDWKTRLRIAFDSAQGLEYLHVSCSPKIVHRDVKSSNILLDSNLRAKMADFGLSKIIGDEVISSHITTTVKGTVGYLDPEYFNTSKLTERSDVYSFGVVLLEMICGRKAIDPDLCEEELSLLKWVMLHVEGSDDYGDVLKTIIDQKLSMSDIDMNSLCHVFNLSLKCIQTEGSKRPTIIDIVIHIKEAMDIIKSEYTTDAINQPRSSIECSYSLLDVGR